jgi:TonB-dependent receptor
MKMTNLRLHLIIPLFGWFLAGGLAYAGNIIGTVMDTNSGGFLPGASVELVGTGRTTTTNADGVYRFNNVPAGSYEIVVRYLGFDTVTDPVQVPATGTQTVLNRMGEEIQELDAFQVEGYLEGRIRALQQKKTSTNTMDIISADSVGSLPDRNVADALSRLPGVNITLDNGEGKFVVIRGIDPNLNNVTLNGANVAAPGVNGRSGRSMPLDVIGSAQISQLEVIKTVTPDMDGNSLGGTINIVSASAWDREDDFVFVSGEVGYAERAEDLLYGLEATWANRLGANQDWGLALSASYSFRPIQVDELKVGWNDENGIWFPEQPEFVPTWAERERIGINGNLEYRPDEDSEFYVRAIYNEFKEDENLEEHIYEIRNVGTISATGGTSDRVRVERREKEETTEQTLFNISVGGSKRFGNWTISPELTYSYAEEFNPLLNWAQWRGEYRDRSGNPAEGISNIVTWDTSEYLFDFELHPITHTDLSPMELRRFRIEDSTVEEKTWTPKIDFQYDYDDWGGGNGFVKFGVKYITRERFVDDNSFRFNNLNADTIMSEYGPHDAGYRVLDKYDTGLLVNWENTFQAFDRFIADGSIAEFPTESASNSVEDDYDFEEDILALYGFTSYNIGKWNFIAGARYEQTDVTVGANEYREDERDGQDFVISPIDPIEIDYNHFFPNVQARYSFSEYLIGRTSITYTVGRPAFEDSAPITSRELQILAVPLDPAFPFEGEVEIGRPDLEAYESWNIDVGLEYYLPDGAGAFTAAVFHKDISNPIFQFEGRGENVTWNGDGYEELQFGGVDNAKSGKVSGLELGMQLPFRFAEAPFDGFGLDANVTFITSEAVIEDVNLYLLDGVVDINRTGDDFPFFRQPDLIYNIALYYEKYGWSAKLAYQYQDKQIAEIGGNVDEDIWRDSQAQLDFQASYRLNDQWKFFFNVKNLTDEEEKFYYGSPDRVFGYEAYGRIFRFGINFDN